MLPWADAAWLKSEHTSAIWGIASINVEMINGHMEAIPHLGLVCSDFGDAPFGQRSTGWSGAHSEHASVLSRIAFLQPKA